MGVWGVRGECAHAQNLMMTLSSQTSHGGYFKLFSAFLLRSKQVQGQKEEDHSEVVSAEMGNSSF